MMLSTVTVCFAPWQTSSLLNAVQLHKGILSIAADVLLLLVVRAAAEPTSAPYIGLVDKASPAQR